MIQPPVPGQLDWAIGMQICLPPYEQLRSLMQCMPPAANRAEIAVCFGMEQKTYTMQEFLLLLGFAVPAPEGVQQKVPGQ